MPASRLAEVPSLSAGLQGLTTTTPSSATSSLPPWAISAQPSRVLTGGPDCLGSVRAATLSIRPLSCSYWTGYERPECKGRFHDGRLPRRHHARARQAERQSDDSWHAHHRL